MRRRPVIFAKIDSVQVDAPLKHPHSTRMPPGGRSCNTCRAIIKCSVKDVAATTLRVIRRLRRMSRHFATSETRSIPPSNNTQKTNPGVWIKRLAFLIARRIILYRDSLTLVTTG